MQLIRVPIEYFYNQLHYQYLETFRLLSSPNCTNIKIVTPNLHLQLLLLICIFIRLHENLQEIVASVITLYIYANRINFPLRKSKLPQNFVQQFLFVDELRIIFVVFYLQNLHGQTQKFQLFKLCSRNWTLLCDKSKTKLA